MHSPLNALKSPYNLQNPPKINYFQVIKYSQRTKSWKRIRDTWCSSFRNPQPCLITFNSSGVHRNMFRCLLFILSLSTVKQAQPRPNRFAQKRTFFLLFCCCLLVDEYCLWYEIEAERGWLNLNCDGNSKNSQQRSVIIHADARRRNFLSRNFLFFPSRSMEKKKFRNYLHGNGESSNTKIDFFFFRRWHFERNLFTLFNWIFLAIWCDGNDSIQ